MPDEIVDKSQQTTACVRNLTKMDPAFAERRLSPHAVAHDLGDVKYRGEGRAQLVAKCGKKLSLDLVGAFCLPFCCPELSIRLLPKQDIEIRGQRAFNQLLITAFEWPADIPF